MRKRLIALLGIALLVAAAAVIPGKGDGGVRVRADGLSPVTPISAVTTSPLEQVTEAPVPSTTTPTTTVAVTTTAVPVPITEPIPVETTDVPPSETTNGPPSAALDIPSVRSDGVTQPAVRVQTTVQVAEPPPTIATWEIPSWARCPQWWPTAQDVGWSLDDMPTLDYIMRRESNCNEAARNPVSCDRAGKYHALGLTQLCGWMPSNEAVVGALNLAKALELRQTQGWCPWVLGGDPVTGHACRH